MEERVEQHVAADGAQGEGRPAPGAAAPPAGDGADRRLQRIMDYLREALARESALEANLGAVNSDLLIMGYRLKQAIDEAMAATPAALEQFQRLMPAIDSYLRLTKQIDRLAQLSLRLASPREAAQAARNGARVAGEEMRL